MNQSCQSQRRTRKHPAIAVVPGAAIMRAIDCVENKSVVAESKTPSAPPGAPATPGSDPLTPSWR